MHLKPKPEYVDLDADFKPLPKHGHLSQRTPEFAAAKPAIIAGYEKLCAAPDFPAVREMAGDVDAVMPPGGPDRYREVTTELLQFPARDGEITSSSLEVDGAENVHAAVNTNIVVISVKYRNCDGLLWCKNNAKALGIKPRKDHFSQKQCESKSSLALEIRDNGITGIVAQILHFPVVGHPKFFAGVIQCAGLDILRDEAFAYAEALETAGVDVEIYGYKGVPHCFPGFLLASPETAEFYKKYNAFLKKCTSGS
ncbi:hypothetical protein DL768_008153 [Monosporascus sp. mg162]|nr:hypothetical protein DL768_008153 [Monosporascus sp. mg162]